MGRVTAFDMRVAAIRAAGIAPKCRPCRLRKATCSEEQWAAHLEYIAARYRDPECKAAHKAYQLRYLAKKVIR